MMSLASLSLLLLASTAPAPVASAPRDESAPAVANATAEEQEKAKPQEGGEIVVTARRRDERLIDVPVAVTAISGEALETRGAIDITDVANMTPNTTL